ncbi:MAG: hypothetical protein ACK4SL_01755 [Candidatus Paceibacteria bacterium]
MIDHDLPPGSTAAAVEEARVRAQNHRSREKTKDTIQYGDSEGESGDQQQAQQPIFKDWASI